MHTIIEQIIKDLQLPLRFEHKLLHDVSLLLSADLQDLEAIILFGSCARGQLRLTSDIDLLIITTTTLDRSIRGDLSSTLEESVDGVKTDAIFYTHEQYEHSVRIFTTQVKNEGIILYSI